jgi:hypothetical protein
MQKKKVFRQPLFGHFFLYSYPSLEFLRPVPKKDSMPSEKKLLWGWLCAKFFILSGPLRFHDRRHSPLFGTFSGIIPQRNRSLLFDDSRDIRP